jgi:coproporphyrinogen III oxidase-like Fe-S oxidoreductase
VPSDDVSADLYAACARTLDAHSFRRYEVSNYARRPQHNNNSEEDDDDKSRHNWQFWRGGDVLGIGPGAASRATLDVGQQRQLLRALDVSNEQQAVWRSRRAARQRKSIDDDDDDGDDDRRKPVDDAVVRLAGKNLRTPQRYASNVMAHGFGLDTLTT